MHRALALVVLLAGCDLVYGLGERPPDPCWNAALAGDEDGDKVVDGCDRCPAFANGNAIDSDEDEILDPCDPDGGRQQLVDFVGFPVDGEGEGWAGATWAIHDDGIVQHDPTAKQMARKEIPATVTPSIEAPIAFLDPVQGSSASVGFMLGSIPVTCRYEYASDDDKVVLDYGGQPIEARYNSAPGLRLRLYQSLDGVFHCQALDATGSSPPLVSPPLVEATTTLATLETNLAIAGYDWVMIIGAESPTR